MVNTFLPYPNFKKSVRSLDFRRLGKQRIETKQILGALRGEYEGWSNHPATKMWEGYEGPLCIYGIRACEEWISRGYNDNTLPFFEDMVQLYDTCMVPWWVGMGTFHRSHQSNLIRKDAAHYGPQFPGIPPDLPYHWPTGRLE